MDRLAYVLRRLAQLVPVVLGVTFVTFLLVHLLPGDPANAVLGVHATPQLVAQLHHKWGLDRSLPAQYWLFLKRARARQPRRLAALPRARCARWWSTARP